GLTSILPVLLMGIRWPTSFGDVSVVGAALTTVMFRLVHVMFLAVCLWVAFDPPFSPRALGGGLPMLTFYYLGALCVGYYSGYLLLVFRDEGVKPWRRTSDLRKAINALFQLAVRLALIAVPAILLYRNLPVLRENNGPELAKLASTLARSLPARGAVVMSDDPLSLLLLEAALERTGTPDREVLLDTRSMRYRVYQQHLAQHYPGRWPAGWDKPNLPATIDAGQLIALIYRQAQSNEVYYLHPSFGFYFEALYPEPRGLLFRLQPYPPNQLTPPPLSTQSARENEAFWRQAGPTLAALEPLVQREQNDPGVTDAEFVGYFYSRALDYWGVELQRTGHLKEAGKCFEDALALNPKNIAAKVNRESNRRLAGEATRTRDLNKSVEERLGQYTSWDAVLEDNGPFDDGNFCYVIAREFTRNELRRQAAVNFQRALAFDPDNVNARFELAGTYLQTGFPDPALKLVGDIHRGADRTPLSATNQVDLACLEAYAYFLKTNYTRAEQVLRTAQAAFPDDAKISDRLYQMYLSLHRYPEALAVIDRRLKQVPDSIDALLARSVVLIQSGAYADAIAPLDRILALAPKNSESYVAALLNRAIANLQTERLDASQRDYEALLNVIPDSYRLYYGLGEIAYRKKDAAAVKKYYDLYLRFVPPATTPEQIKERNLVSQRLKELKTGR
ncbi:MAG: tetratricopeptide repeat protein, partial [Verrucomicrobia bacterium]|nr:tetratricopeptide repeat protein [Verrucomicrobiota bacterium]